MTHFFVSYTRADLAWAEWIAWQLEAVGHRTTLQAWDFRPGTNFVAAMQQAVAKADRTLAVLSQAYYDSGFGAAEWQAAFAQDPTGEHGLLLPVRVEECRPPGLLRPIVYVDLVGLDEATARERLLAGLDRTRAKPSTAPAFPSRTPPGRDKPPFPGAPEHPDPSGTRPSPTSGHLLNQAEASTHFDRHGWGGREDRRRSAWATEPWMGTVIVPQRQGVPYVDELALGREEFQNLVLRLALTPPGAVFRADRATERNETLDSLVLDQRAGQFQTPTAVLEVHTDGTIVHGLALERRRSASSSYSLAESHIIDEEAVRRALAAFFALARGLYTQLGHETGGFWVGASLTGVANKYFGRLPGHELSGITIASHQLEDPLRIPPRGPLSVESEQLADAESLASLVVDHIMRVFRVAKSYYKP